MDTPHVYYRVHVHLHQQKKKDESVDHCACERKNMPEHEAGVGARSKGHQLA